MSEDRLADASRWRSVPVATGDVKPSRWRSVPPISTTAQAQPEVQGPSTTVPGLAAGFARGAAPYAAGAAVGAGIGAPIAGVGAVPGAIAGISATAATQLSGDVLNWISSAFGGPQGKTPQHVTDQVFDAIGIRRPQTGWEGVAEEVGGLGASMFGVPVKSVSATPTKPSQALLRDFERQRVTPNIPTVGQSRFTGLQTQMGKNVPIVSEVLRKSVGNMLSETKAAVDRAAAKYGASFDQHDAGAIVDNAVKRFAGNRSQAEGDYGKFFATMAGAPPAKVDNTLSTVNKMMGRFKEAPGLVGLFTSSPIAKLRQELSPQQVAVPAKVSSVLGPSGEPVVTQAAYSFQRGGVLGFRDLQELRSQIGYKLENPGSNLGPDHIPRAQLKELYGALSRDMRTAAKARGPDALRLFEGANANYAMRMNLIDRLEPLISGEAPERIYARLNTAAMDRGAADAGLLRSAKKVMTPHEWGDFGASLLSRMAEPMPGAKDTLKDTQFSAASFTTNWNKLSEKAKDILFGPDTFGSPRNNIESLLRVTQAEKNVAALANHPHTAEMLIAGHLSFAAALAAWEALTKGELMPVVGLATGTGVAYGFAKMLMSPQFARWLYSVPTTTAASPENVARYATNLINALTTPSETGPLPGTAVTQQQAPPPNVGIAPMLQQSPLGMAGPS